MREGRASRTAQQNALFRALESSRPARLRLFEDPLAGRLLARRYALAATLARLPGLRAFVPWYIDKRWPGVRTSVVARTRLIDDAIREALREPFAQLVVLGAGFDSRAYRLPELRRLLVFEVDHPDTQRAKRKALVRARVEVPHHVRYVASDFARSHLEEEMAEAGYARSARTFLLWEGVTNYLSAESVDETLAFCADAAPGSALLFTYVHRDLFVNPGAFAGIDRVFAALERAGERFTFGFDPADLPGHLAGFGLSLVSDVGAAEYRERYYGGAARRMRGHEFYRVALCRVVGPEAGRQACGREHPEPRP